MPRERSDLQDSRDSALTWLTAIRDSAPAHYLALRSFAAQYQGFSYDVRSDYVHMLAAYDSAVAENRTTREPGVTLRVGSWLAQARGGAARARSGMADAVRRARGESSLSDDSTSSLLGVRLRRMATATEAPRLSLRYCDESVRIARRMI